jgi:STE24 endopeptidase
MTLAAPAALRAIAALTDRLDRRGALPGATIPALALSAGLASAAVSVPSLALSRAIERRADAFALELTGAPEAFISFERRIVLQNLADPDPPRWLTVVLGTHPSTVERIGIAEAYRERLRA